MHGCSCRWHLHAPVHQSLAFLHLHLSVVHALVQPHDITSMQLCGTGDNDISCGTSFPSSQYQPLPSGDGRIGKVQLACLYTIAWKCALLMCRWRESLVGGRYSGPRHLVNIRARHLLVLSTVVMP